MKKPMLVAMSLCALFAFTARQTSAEEDKPKTFAELMAIIGEEPETRAK